jgi:hypothetical protein
MALVGYILPIDFVPNPKYINDPLQEEEYVGFRLSTDKVSQTSIWTFGLVVDAPTTDLAVLLPPSAKQVTIDDDLIKFGYRRQLFTGLTINDVEDLVNQNIGDKLAGG